MALTPAEQNAKNAGWSLPQGSEYISNGDDAIRANAAKAYQELQAAALDRSTIRTEITAGLDAIADSLPTGMVPIFETLAEALAWEAANPGRVALTIESQEPDTTPPTSAGILTVDPGDVYANLSVAGAVDDRGITGYSFRVGSGTWSNWLATPAHTITGLSKSTAYTFQHRVRDAGGNTLDGVSVTAETLAVAPIRPGDVITSDNFTGDGTGTRTTTAYAGGSPMPYTGTITTANGALTLANNGTFAHLPATLPFERADLQVDFRLLSAPTSASAEIVARMSGQSVALLIESTSFRVRYGNGEFAGAAIGSPAAGNDYRVRFAGSTIRAENRTTGAVATVETAVTGSGGFGIMLRNSSAIDNLVVTAL